MKKRKEILALLTGALLIANMCLISIPSYAVESNQNVATELANANFGEETKFGFEHTGEGDTFIEEAYVGAEVGFMITGLKEGETVVYTLSDEEVGEIAYSDNEQVTVALLKEGKTTLTATASDGQSFEVEFIVKSVEIEPVPLEYNPSEETKFGFEHTGEGDTFIEEAYVGAEVGFMITGLKEGETVVYTLSDEEVGKIAYSDNEQVTVALLKEGKTTLTATASDGQSFEVEFIVKSVEIEPVPLVTVVGDCNDDGKFTIIDVVLLV